MYAKTSEPINNSKVIIKANQSKSNLDITSTFKEKREEYSIKMLEACVKGDEIEVTLLIKKYKIKDISMIRGYQGVISIGTGKAKRTYKTDNWNPLLICLGYKRYSIALIIFQ